MLSETKLTAKYCKILRKNHGLLVFNIHGHDMQEAGWPDTFMCHWKFRVWIEFKGPNTDLDPLQSHILKQLTDRRAVGLVARFYTERRIGLSNYDESLQYAVVKGSTYNETAVNLKIALESIYNVLTEHQTIKN